MDSQKAARESVEESASKKRKWSDTEEEFTEKKQHAKSKCLGSNLRSQTAFSLDWQQCLDVKTGHVYYYNTMTKKRDSCDLNPVPMSLELQLNLPCQDVGNDQDECNKKQESGKNSCFSSKTSISSKGLNRSTSWLTFEEDQQEMFTAVCKKCYLLVIMCKSSPACPNCKFMQPPGQTFKQSLSLLC